MNEAQSIQTVGDFRTTWKRLAQEKKVSRYDMALLCLMKAIHSSKEDHLARARRLLGKSFTPVKKQIKLDNGAKPYGTLFDALFWYGHNWSTPGYKPSPELLILLKPEEFEEINGIVAQIINGSGEVTL